MQLNCQNLSFEIKGKKILHPCDIQFKKAKITTILGPNGAGKSTLVHLLSGGERPSSGIVKFNNREISSISHAAFSKFRAVLSQQNNISFPIQVNDVVAFGRHPHCENYLSKKDFKIVQEALAFFKLTDFKNRQYQSLSGGEKQRVHFARIWAQLFDTDLSGKILFLDEPLTYLDINFQIEFLNTLKEWSIKGLTIIGVLHHINLALLFSDEIVLIDQGKIIAQEAPQEVIKNKRIDSLFHTKSIVFQSDQHQHLCFEP